MSNYSRHREKAYIDSQIKKDLDLQKELRALYRQSMRVIEDDMARWLGKYATEKGISFEEARKIVSKTDVEALAKKAKVYVQEKNFSAQANEEMRRYNLAMRMNRHELLRNEINLELIALGNEEAKLLASYFNSEYLLEVQRQAGILNMTSQAQVTLQRNMSKVVDSSYKTVRWSDRLWTNNDSLRSRVEIGLRTSMLQGENPRVWAKRLRAELNKEMVPMKGKDNAIFRTERLAITESGRIQIEAQLDSYKSMGYDSLEVITEPGACPICLKHDGKIVKVKDAIQGVNIPIFHPFCRCSTAAISDYDLDKELKKVDEEQPKIDQMGKKEKFLVESRGFNAHQLESDKRFWLQNNSQDAQKTVKLTQRFLKENPDLTPPDKIVIAKQERHLGGIAGYRQSDDTLFISDILSDSLKVNDFLGDGYFASKDAQDILLHELIHKRYWDHIKEFYNANETKYNSLTDAKRAFDEPIRSYLIRQVASDPLYLQSEVSSYSYHSFREENQLNEVISEIIIKRTGDNQLRELVKEAINYDD